MSTCTLGKPNEMKSEQRDYAAKMRVPMKEFWEDHLLELKFWR